MCRGLMEVIPLRLEVWAGIYGLSIIFMCGSIFDTRSVCGDCWFWFATCSLRAGRCLLSHGLAAWLGGEISFTRGIDWEGAQRWNAIHCIVFELVRGWYISHFVCHRYGSLHPRCSSLENISYADRLSQSFTHEQSSSLQVHSCSTL